MSSSLEMRTNRQANCVNVTCSPLSADGIWKAVEGIYFMEEKVKHKESSNINEEYEEYL